MAASPSYIFDGTEFLVNSVTSDNQRDSSVVGLADGTFVVTWESYGAQDGSAAGIYAQHYDANGGLLGPETLVNSTTTLYQVNPSITALDDGGYVIVWASNGNAEDTDSYGIFGQRYDASGTASGTEFFINTETSSSQYDPSITALSDGGFIVTWESAGDQDGDGYGIYAQRYDDSGAKDGGEFLINSYAVSDQDDPDITALTGGGFVVTWVSFGQDGDVHGVYAQQYNAAGVKVNGEFRVNTTITSAQDEPKTIGLSDGGFMVIWSSLGQDGSGDGVYGQRYDSGGTPVGSEFSVNTTTAENQYRPSITLLVDGGFVIAWASNQESGGGGYGIYGQRYDANGDPIGDEFHINTTTDSTQTIPAIASLADGGFVVTWDNYDTVSGYYDVHAQQFKAQLFGTNDDNTFSDTVGAGWMDGLDGDDTLHGLEGDDKIYGHKGDDTLFGDQGDDVLDGGVGTDTLRGGLGDDRLYGGGGNDDLRGGDGADRLKGNNGDDTLNGGKGADRLFGGTGADKFVFITVSDSNQTDGVDKIKDFEVGIDDVDLSGLIAGTFTYLGASGFTGTAQEVRVTVNANGNSLVQIDGNGDGIADMKFYIADTTTLTVDDFIL